MSKGTTIMDVLRRARQMEGLDMSVGIQATQAGTKHGATSILQVAIWNEFGTRDIPERPFLRSAGVNSGAEWLRLLSEAIAEYALGVKTRAAFEQKLRRLGLKMTADVRANIVNLRTPPNAASTIARKGSDNPLVDTGQLVRSIRSAIIRPGQPDEVVG